MPQCRSPLVITNEDEVASGASGSVWRVERKLQLQTGEGLGVSVTLRHGFIVNRGDFCLQFVRYLTFASFWTFDLIHLISIQF